jgi:anti-anti-sigma regulatory factor
MLTTLGFTTRLEHDPDQVVFFLQGSFGYPHLPQFKTAFLLLLEQPLPILIDLRSVRYIDSSGLGALMWSRKESEAHHHAMSIQVPTRLIERNAMKKQLFALLQCVEIKEEATDEPQAVMDRKNLKMEETLRMALPEIAWNPEVQRIRETPLDTQRRLALHLMELILAQEGWEFCTDYSQMIGKLESRRVAAQALCEMLALLGCALSETGSTEEYERSYQEGTAEGFLYLAQRLLRGLPGDSPSREFSFYLYESIAATAWEESHQFLNSATVKASRLLALGENPKENQ